MKNVTTGENAQTIDYTNSATKLFQWQIIATLALIAVTFMAGFIGGTIGLSAATATNSAMVIGIAIYVFAYVIGLIRFAENYPGLKEGFWPKFWAGFLTFTRIGWDQIGLKNLPWKVIMTWGLAATIFSPSVLSTAGDPATFVTSIILSIIILPAMTALIYGIGYGARALFGK